MPTIANPSPTSAAKIELDPNRPIILFDGVCNLCNASVNFIIDRDRQRRFRFAALQSPAGQELLRRFGLPADELKSMVLIVGNRCFARSSAGLRIARYLGGGWPLLSVFLLVPPPLRNLVYDAIARRRYAWFGMTEECRVPTPELQERFL